MASDLDETDEGEGDGAIELPIDGTLDLHTFSPRDLKDLIPDYIAACLEKGILELRIIHGKGQGVLRRSVQSLLSRDPRVLEYKLADESGGGWGATLVRLRGAWPS
jgi:DNA-nicking Smr family endonuclease